MDTAPTRTRPPAPKPAATTAQLSTMTAVTGATLRRPDGTAIRVLVVDDDAVLADLLTMALRYEGWE